MPLMSAPTFVISFFISSAAVFDLSDSFLTSSATMEKPLPCSPALAASIAALRASRFVWSAIYSISVTIFFMLSASSIMVCISLSICVSVSLTLFKLFMTPVSAFLLKLSIAPSSPAPANVLNAPEAFTACPLALSTMLMNLPPISRAADSVCCVTSVSCPVKTGISWALS